MGYTQETLNFLDALNQNNNREWFEDNRAQYEAEIKDRSLDLIADLSEDMSNLSPALRAEPRLNGSFRRVNRDTRFSKDKTPYSPRIHLVFWHEDHPNRSPAMHFVLRADGVGMGAGQWGIEPDRLRTLRDRIVDDSDGRDLENALEKAESVNCRMGNPDLVRVPRGYDADHPRANLLRYKGFVARTHEHSWPTTHMIGEGAKVWMLEKTSVLLPLIRWLSA